jgi:hypothetical protein
MVQDLVNVYNSSSCVIQLVISCHQSIDLAHGDIYDTLSSSQLTFSVESRPEGGGG